MNNTFKTLVSKQELFPDIINYVHPVEKQKTKDKWLYEWGICSTPLLLSPRATIKDLKNIYKGLDFRKVILKTITVEEKNNDS